MGDYELPKCPKCKLRAVGVKYRERRTKTASKWIMEYRCAVGHKWTRVMDRSEEQ